MYLGQGTRGRIIGDNIIIAILRIIVGGLSWFIFAVDVCCIAAGPKVEGPFRIRNLNFGRN